MFLSNISILIAVVQNKQGILQAIQSRQPEIKNLGVEKLGLFGSFARGQQSENSDLDLVVEFEEGRKKYRNLLSLLDLLQEVFQRKVDLLTWEGMATFVQREAKKDMVYVTFTD